MIIIHTSYSTDRLKSDNRAVHEQLCYVLENMTFEFINNAAIDRSVRKQIRSHVAKGRNIGKTLPSRRRQPKVKTTVSIWNPRTAKDAPEPRSGEGAIPTIERQIGDGLSVLSLPVELTSATSRNLAKTLFTFLNGSLHSPELSNAIDFAGAAGIWVEYIFLDEAYFHCTVAMCVIAVNALRIEKADSVEAMHHMSDTFRLVNQKLSGKEALSDTTMAVIVALSHYERVRGRHCQGMVHFEGLHRIVELRGGILRLVNYKAALAQKIFRADLEFALFSGSATRFSVKDVPGSATISWLRSRFKQDQKGQVYDSKFFNLLSPDLKEVLIDIMGLAWQLNGHGTKLDGYTYHDILILIGYRLLYIGSLGDPRPSNRLENALHLGLLAFFTTLLLGFGREFPEFPLLSKLTRSAAQGHLEEYYQNQDFFLWALFMGRISTLGQPDDRWLILRITETCLGLGLHTWENTCRTLSKFPWINSLHDKAGEALWNRLRESDNFPAGIQDDILIPRTDFR
ncbi:hypothetical protein G7Y89_g799 [Cudoniella acicularis]|uniref:Tachykinin family protein n=1 Tax=Cudoniella acicularis TaxID=354080 RepID=A0A8H4W803_9HELO|nr:hypothetical protein G7Y89_g799 [Cudoniella acicularis]